MFGGKINLLCKILCRPKNKQTATATTSLRIQIFTSEPLGMTAPGRNCPEGCDKLAVTFDKALSAISCPLSVSCFPRKHIKHLLCLLQGWMEKVKE